MDTRSKRIYVKPALVKQEKLSTVVARNSDQA